jgi:hypothetical protein
VPGKTIFSSSESPSNLKIEQQSEAMFSYSDSLVKKDDSLFKSILFILTTSSNLHKMMLPAERSVFFSEANVGFLEIMV